MQVQSMLYIYTLTLQLASHSGNKFGSQTDTEHSTEQHYPCHSVQVALLRHKHSIPERTPTNPRGRSKAETPPHTP